MDTLKRVIKLREHVLSENIAGGLTAELVNNTGKNDFFVVFLSVCNKKERAKVFHGSGNTIAAAWANAEKRLNAFRERAMSEKKPFSAVWIKADVVTSYEEIPTVSLNKMIIKEQWSNFLRIGISLEPDFTNAYIEAEVHGNKMLTYYTEREFNAKNFNYNSCRISLDNLNHYRKKRGKKPVASIPERITVFITRGFFCGEDDVIHELYSDNMDFGRRRTDLIDSEVVREIIIGASTYLANQIDSEGKFTYGFYPVFDNLLKSYNIVRHVSSLWSLVNLYRMSNDDSLIPKLDSALDFMLAHIEYKDEDTAYLIERKAGEIKLGANGVAIIMYTEYMDVFRSEKYVDIVRKLANGILELQNHETGEYWHVLEFPGFTRKEEFRTVYYDGEATFALARAYTYTKEQKYLDSAKAAVDNFIAKDYTKHRDHWVAYSLFEVTKYVWDVKYYEFALRNAEVNLPEIFNRATSFHTYLEMLMASWRTYQRAVKYNVNSEYIRNYDPTYFAQTIYNRARHMLNGFFYPEYAMYMKVPEKVVGSFMVRHHNYRVRIDDIQHFIGGYFFYSVYYNEIKQHLTDEFIRGLDVSSAVSEVAEEENTFSENLPDYDEKMFMVYHLNKDFTGELGASEHAAIKRLTMFKNAGIASKIVTSVHNIDLHENMKKYAIPESDFENVYDFFQNTGRAKVKKIEVEDIFPATLYKWRKLTYEDRPEVTDYRIVLSKRRVAFMHYEGDKLVYINRFDSKGRKAKRSFYDCRGFLSVEKLLNNEGQTVLEVFYSPKGDKVIEKHYYDTVNDKPALSAIRLKTGRKWRVLPDEDALIGAYLDSLLNPKKDFLIVDNSAAYLKALRTVSKKVMKSVILHKKHNKGDEAHTDDIINEYRELFKSLHEFDAVITYTDEQRRDIIRRYKNSTQMFAVPSLYTTEFEKEEIIDKWKRLFSYVSAKFKGII